MVSYDHSSFIIRSSGYASIFFPKTVPNQHNGSEIELLVKDDHPPALQNDNNLVCLALFCNLTKLLCIVSA